MCNAIPAGQHEFPVDSSQFPPPGMPGDPPIRLKGGNAATRDNLAGDRFGSFKLAAHPDRSWSELLEISHGGRRPLPMPRKIRQVAIDLRDGGLDVDAHFRLPHGSTSTLDGGKSRQVRRP